MGGQLLAEDDDPAGLGRDRGLAAEVVRHDAGPGAVRRGFSCAAGREGRREHDGDHRREHGHGDHGSGGGHGLVLSSGPV
ncbi:MAG: hypothetical protein ACFCVG_06070 [Kineosporiaceae bacterium]